MKNTWNVIEWFATCMAGLMIVGFIVFCWVVDRFGKLLSWSCWQK